MKALLRVVRGTLFFVVYAVFAVLAGLVQRVVIWPLSVVLRGQRIAIVGAWFRLMANGSIAIWDATIGRRVATLIKSLIRIRMGESLQLNAGSTPTRLILAFS